jgi:hypothetical protein
MTYLHIFHNFVKEIIIALTYVSTFQMSATRMFNHFHIQLTATSAKLHILPTHAGIEH